jgi:hypothetical protein
MHSPVTLPLLQLLDCLLQLPDRLLRLPDVLSQSPGGLLDLKLEPSDSINDRRIGAQSRSNGAPTPPWGASSSASGGSTTRS